MGKTANWNEMIAVKVGIPNRDFRCDLAANASGNKGFLPAVAHLLVGLCDCKCSKLLWLE